MKSVNQYISKGFYKYSQIGNFISVKNYIFIRHNNKKCLLLRFLNETEYPINSFEYTVVQMDASGKILAKTKMSHRSISLDPGKTYTLSHAIVVDEYCSDFKILFSEVYSENYKYHVRDGEVIAHYIKKEPPLLNKYEKISDVTGFSVKPKRFGKPRLAVFLAIIMILAVFALNIIFSVSKNISSRSLYGKDVSLAELYDQGEPSSKFNSGDQYA